MFMGILARLVCRLIMTCRGALTGGMVLGDLARLPTPSKMEIMYGCWEDRRSFTGLGPMGI